MDFPRNHFPCGETRPRMLKDFLAEDSNSSSSPSNGFRSFPRNPLDSTLISPKSSYFLAKLYSFQSVINVVVKSIHSATAKTPSILPRSLTRKLSKRGKKIEENEEITAPDGAKLGVKVKDIIRWASSRDLAEIESPPLDSTTTSGSATTSAGSSWCDSDFSATSDFLPLWNGAEDENIVKASGKNYLPRIGDEPTYPTGTPANVKVGPKESEEEEEDGSSSSIDQSFANVERTRDKLMEKLQRFERLAKMDLLRNWTSMDEPTSPVEEEDRREEATHELEDDDVEADKAWELLNNERVASPSPLEISQDGARKLLLDFFMEELSNSQKHASTSERFGFKQEETLIERAVAWAKGEHVEWMKRKDHLKDMDMGVASKFKEEQEEIAFAIGDETLAVLIDDLLIDLLLD